MVVPMYSAAIAMVAVHILRACSRRSRGAIRDRCCSGSDEDYAQLAVLQIQPRHRSSCDPARSAVQLRDEGGVMTGRVRGLGVTEPSALGIINPRVVA